RPGAFLSCTGFSSAMAAAANAVTTRVAMASVRMVSTSGHVDRHAVNDVVMVARRVVDQVSCLRLPDLVGGTGHCGLLAPGLQSEGEGEAAKGKAPEVFAQRRRNPGLATIGRHFHDPEAVAAIPSNTPDRDRSARLDAGTLRMACYQRVHYHFSDRCID